MRKTIFFIIFIILILAIAVLFINHQKKKNLVEAAEIDIILEVVEGSAVIKSGQEEKNIEQGMTEATEGDIIKTGDNSLAILYFSDNTLMRLDENTEITVEFYNKKDDSFSVKIWLALGQVWSRVEKIVESGSSYEVQTSNTVAAVRGTFFGITRTAEETEVVLTETENELEVEAINPETKQAIVESLIRLKKNQSTKIIDKELPNLKKPLVARLLTDQDFQKRWLKFNSEEDKESLINLRIEEKRKHLKELKQQIRERIRAQSNSQTESSLRQIWRIRQELFLRPINNWQNNSLNQRLQILKASQIEALQPLSPESSTGTNSLIQPLPSTIKPSLPLPPVQSQPTSTPPADLSPTKPLLEILNISGIEPAQGVGNGCYNSLSANISGSGFVELKEIYLGGALINNFKVISSNQIIIEISGQTPTGFYDLVIYRSDDAKTILPQAFQVLGREYCPNRTQN